MTLVVPFTEIFKNEVGLLAKHSSWDRIELGKVCSILNGYAFKSNLFNKETGYPIIRIRDLAKNSTETFFNGSYTEEYLVSDGDLLVGMDGNFGCYQWSGGTALLNQRVCKLIPNEEYLNKNFLLYSLNGYLKAIQEATSSVTVGHLSSRDMQKIPMPFPPLNEQKRIVEKLEKLLGRVEAVQARLDKIPAILKRFRQSVLAAACSGKLTADWRNEANTGSKRFDELDGLLEVRRTKWQELCPTKKLRDPEPFKAESLPEIPDSWIWVSADSVCYQITDGEHIQPPYQETGLPMLSAKHVRDGYVTLDGAGQISAEDFKIATARCAPKNGDLLIVSVGATTGRSAIVADKPPFAIVRSVLLLKPTIDPTYLLRWTQSAWCLQWMSQASGASAQPHLYIKDTRQMPVPLPPSSEREEIVRRVEELFKFADAVEERYKRTKAHTDKLTQSILAKAFRGELVPQDPTDEPASAMLERVKRQKEI